MISIESIYSDYLDKLQEETKKKYDKYKGWFSASQAGKCYKQQWYRINDTESQPFEEKTKRILRLGTVIHNDIQASLIELRDKNQDWLKNVDILIEERIELPEYNVVGHLDIAVVDGENHIIYLTDLKSINEWNYKIKFGLIKNRKPTSNHYSLQVGTYGLGLLKYYKDTYNEDYNIQMDLLWYNKNDSRMKSGMVEEHWINAATMYWEDLNEFLDEVGDEISNILPETAIGIPFSNWECNYCQYSKICKGE